MNQPKMIGLRRVIYFCMSLAVLVASQNNNNYFLGGRYPQNFGYSFLPTPTPFNFYFPNYQQQHQPSQPQQSQSMSSVSDSNSKKAAKFFNDEIKLNSISTTSRPSPSVQQPKQHPLVAKSTNNDDRWSCPSTKWSRLRRKCYQIFPSRSNTWKKALDNCSGYGGLLALVDSRETQKFLAALLSKYSDEIGVFAWIGTSRLTSATDYQWVMDKTTQDNYKHDFYASDVRAPEKFNLRSLEQLEWARNEPSLGADGCGALAAYNKKNSNYFYFREFDGKAFDLPCDNIKNENSQPPYTQAAWAICEMRASNSAAASSGSQPRVQGDIVYPNMYSDFVNAPVTESLVVNDWLVPNGYWLAGFVPYEFDLRTFTSKVERNIVEKQLRQVEKDSDACVTFRQKTGSDLDYIKFVRTMDASCASRGIGRRGGMQEIYVGPVCLGPDGLQYVKHEILHALGLPHEHQRPDRDNYITVLEDNIVVPARSQFFRLNVSLPWWESFPYDFESLMHYQDNAFSYSPSNLQSIECKVKSKAGLLREANRHVSEIDKQKLKRLYCNSQASETETEVNIPPFLDPSSNSNDKSLILMCILQFWSFGKADLPARIAVSDTPPALCTHIAYFAARIEDGKVAFAVGQGWNAEDAGKHLPKIIALRQQNPKLKIILVMQLDAERGGGKKKWGGKHRGSGKRRIFNDATSSSESLVDKIIAFCRENHVDGVMLAERREIDPDEIPHSPETRPPQSPVLSILYKMRFGIDAEAQQTGKSPLLLFTSIPAPTLRTAPDVITEDDAAVINQHADYVWLRPNRGGPQLPRNSDTGIEFVPGVESNAVAAVEGAMAQGVSAQKIIMSVETSWRSYILDDENNWKPGEAGTTESSGAAITDETYEWKLSAQKKGKDGTAGRVSYTELCLDMQRNAWTHTSTLPDATAEPYAARGNLWVKYDSPASATNKVTYARQRGLAGVATTSLAYDDPHGYCGQRFPLTRAVHDALRLGPVDGIEVAGAVPRRCLSFNGALKSGTKCELELTCGYFPRTSFSDKEVDCAGLTTGAEQSCMAPNEGDCFLNAAARKAVAQRGGSLDGALISVGVAGSSADASIVMNCNQYTPFKIGHTRYYFYCSHNFMNESSINVYDCPDGSEFKYKRFACLAD